MRRLIKFTWILTTLSFLGVLLWEYSYLPLNVGVLAGSKGEITTFISREKFFYIVLAIFAFSNGVLYSLRRLIILNITASGKSLPAAKESLQNDLADWMLGFAASLNVFFIFALIYLGFFNNSSGVNLAHYGPFVYGGPVLIGILLGILIYLLLKKRTEQSI